ncbi:MAG: hypothetical protein IT256_06820 [Chitinophagaceae bacterium]|nr:hypothetical protein [Chitinophagaceae bacterium]
MQAAYFSFGKDGFGLIVEQYIKTVKKQFWVAYKLSFIEIIKTSKFIIACLWMTFLWVAVFLTKSKPESWEYDYVYYATTITFIATTGMFFYVFFIKEDKYNFIFGYRKGLMTWQKTIKRIPKIVTINLFFIVLLNALKLDFLSAMYGLVLLSSFSVLDLIVRLKTAQKLSKKLSF